MKIHDLSPLQQNVLDALYPEESLTRMELKERVNITVKSTLSRIISRLEVFGLIEKTEEEVPGHLQLTAQGKQLIAEKLQQEAEQNPYDFITSEEVQKSTDSYIAESAEIEAVTAVVDTVQPDIEWLRQLSLDVAGRVRNETDLNRIAVYSRASADLASTYAILNDSQSRIVFDMFDK